MFVAASVAILITMTLAMIRALAGPTVYDRILALNLFGTKTVLLLAVFGFLTGRAAFLDLALVYALINFIGVIAMVKFFEYGDLGAAEPALAAEAAPDGAGAPSGGQREGRERRRKPRGGPEDDGRAGGRQESSREAGGRQPVGRPEKRR